MAIQKNSRNRKQGASKKPASIAGPYIFWLVFIIIILLLFIINWKNISNTVKNTGFLDHITKQTNGADNPPQDEEPPAPPVEPLAPAQPVVTVTPPAGTEDGAAPLPGENRDRKPVAPANPPPVDPPAAKPVEPPKPPVVPQPAVQPPVTPAPAPAPPVAPKEETRRNAQRAVYLMKVDNGGNIIRTRANRVLPVSDSPMVDALNSLLRGPTAEEERQGLISLIPPGTRILSATVRGSTAYVNFSEEFQFNTYSAEGYIAQLRQIVWTITEFSNVKDIQILIEGRRLDYLGEGIWIGSPLSRDDY
ncbi:MAG: GerMN domain-containing protein [Treponema sp.]|nr:GerMN domain-containing protein [Treponema sp.]